MKYLGRDTKTGEWLAEKPLVNGLSEVVRFKTLREMDEAIIADYNGRVENYEDGGVESFSLIERWGE